MEVYVVMLRGNNEESYEDFQSWEHVCCICATEKSARGQVMDMLHKQREKASACGMKFDVSFDPENEHFRCILPRTASDDVQAVACCRTWDTDEYPDATDICFFIEKRPVID